MLYLCRHYSMLMLKNAAKPILYTDDGTMAANPNNIIDDTSVKLTSLLVSGYSSKQIAHIEKTPLSTIQKRIRKIIQKGFVSIRIEPNYRKFGLKVGSVTACVTNDRIYSAAEMISKIDGILSVSIHAGNSDIHGFFLYKNTRQALGLVSEIKGIQGIERVEWSEEVVMLPRIKKENALSLHDELDKSRYRKMK